MPKRGTQDKRKICSKTKRTKKERSGRWASTAGLGHLPLALSSSSSSVLTNQLAPKNRIWREAKGGRRGTVVVKAGEEERCEWPVPASVPLHRPLHLPLLFPLSFSLIYFILSFPHLLSLLQGQAHGTGPNRAPQLSPFACRSPPLQADARRRTLMPRIWQDPLLLHL